MAINHDAEAVAMHTANHPHTRHYCESVWKVDPVKATGGRPVALAWFSPDCKHFSRAKGGKPVEKKIRGLAWVVIRWARRVCPAVIMLENVMEFADWGPLDDNDRPCPRRKGLTFRKWAGTLRGLGYEVEFRTLKASHYGAPTDRERFFLVARRDGRPIRWPERTHGPGLLPYRTAAECIDWSLPCHSIFLTPAEARRVGCKRPLAEKTLRRIAKGYQKYVVENPRPYIVRCDHGGPEFRGQPAARPLATITGRHGFGVATPYLTRICQNGSNGSNGSRTRPVDAPLPTIVSKNEDCLIAPFLTAQFGEREGQAPRTHPVDAPLPTVTPRAGGGFPLIAPHLTRYFGGMVGREADAPLPTITAVDHHAIAAAHLIQYNGEKGRECRGQAVDGPIRTVTAEPRFALAASFLETFRGTGSGAPADAPAPTITAQGNHLAEVRAFLMKYNGTAVGQDVRAPIHTITPVDRFGLVTVRGRKYQVVDFGLRMLRPRELYRCQGFPDSYVIDPVVAGRRLPGDAQVRMVGNSVCPQVSEALVRANFPDECAAPRPAPKARALRPRPQAMEAAS